MDIKLRPPTPADTGAVGRILFGAFCSIADRHNFPHDFPAMEAAVGFAQMWINHPSVWGVIAEADGRVVGSNFLDERGPIRGVGPITVDPTFQGKGVGRTLMQAVIERGKDAKGVRLVQDAFNTTSMSLYASLGFDVREPLVLMRGRCKSPAAPDAHVRPMTPDDLPQCNQLCQRVHGIDRGGELADAIKMFNPHVLERDGKIVSYASAPWLWVLNHAVAESARDLQTLLLGVSATGDEPISMLIPTRDAELFRWCLSQGLRVVKPMTLMTMGWYQPPALPYFPSVLC